MLLFCHNRYMSNILVINIKKKQHRNYLNNKKFTNSDHIQNRKPHIDRPVSFRI